MQAASEELPTLNAPLHAEGPRHQKLVNHEWLWYLIAAGIFLLLGVWSTWGAWWGGITTHTVTPSSDPSLMVWSLEYTAKSLAHFSLPAFTTLLNYPFGMNIFANVTILGLGIPLTPLTWLFGPIFTFNFIQMIAPLAGGLAMVYALRRHNTWWPAAIAAGAFWGFSPYDILAQSWGWSIAFFLVVPPLVWAAMHELIFTRKRSPLIVGPILGLLLVWQFMIGEETFVMMVIPGAVIAVAVICWQLVVERKNLQPLIRNMLIGFGAGAGVAFILLGYPVYQAILGKRHLGTWAWPKFVFTSGSTFPHTYFGPLTLPSSTGPFAASLNSLQPNPYLIEIGVPIVFLLVLLINFKDARLWIMTALIGFGVLTGEGYNTFMSPQRLFVNLPFVHNVLPSRWAVVVIFGASMGLAIGISDTARRVPKIPFRWGVGGVLIVGALAPIVPMYPQVLPLSVAAAPAPSWMDTHHGGVAMIVPSNMGLNQLPYFWEGENGIPNSLIGKFGPAAGPFTSAQKTANSMLFMASYAPANGSGVSPSQIGSLKLATQQWGVTDALSVVPQGTPSIVWGATATISVAMFYEAFGAPTSTGPGWWSWHITPHSHGPVVPLSVSVSCNTQAGNNPNAAIACLEKAPVGSQTSG